MIGSRESVEAEREAFGVDHCEIGRLLGSTWNFPPALVAVLEHHHDPAAGVTAPLVRLIALVDQFCEMHGVALGTSTPRRYTNMRDQSVLLLGTWLPSLRPQQRNQLADALEADFRNLMRHHFLNPWG